MVDSESTGRWKRVLRYTFGGAVCLLAVVATWAGMPWYWAVVILCFAYLVIVGSRRIFRPGVTRTADEIVCRFVPWYEGNAYYLCVLLPLMGIASFAAGYAPGNPAWLRFTGILLLGVTPLMVFAGVRMWRRCLLGITPSMLTVRLAVLGSELTEIRREHIQSIEPKMVPNAVSGKSLQVAIAYRPADLSTPIKTVLLGLQLSVQPVNLLDALVAWKAAAHDESGELLDRIERILRGRSTADR